MPFAHKEVYGSTLRDHTHRGPNQAGNKSLISYRTDKGIPGYTGFIPTSAAIPIPIKIVERTGRPADQEALTQLTTNTVDARRQTEYEGRFVIDRDDIKPVDRSGGGYTVNQRISGPAPPFIASSIYQAEILDGATTAKKQLEAVDGLTGIVSKYEAARRANVVRRSQSVDVSSVRGRTTASLGKTPTFEELCEDDGRWFLQSSKQLRPGSVATSKGELVGYQTTYGTMTDRVYRNLDESRAASAGTASSVVSEPRFATLPRVMVPGMYGLRTTNQQDFGEESSDPVARQAPSQELMTRMATTADLAGGTTRVSNAIPGYTGHIPSSKFASESSRRHGEAAEPRSSAKQDMLLHNLHQFPRGRVPGYTGFKPMANQNIRTIQPANLPSAATTKGEADLHTTSFGLPKREPSLSYHNNSRVGLMSFFNGSITGTEHVSANGLSNAETFYRHARPIEALAKTSLPSKLTNYGAPFRTAASMV